MGARECFAKRHLHTRCPACESILLIIIQEFVSLSWHNYVLPAWLNIASILDRRNMIAFERSLYVQMGLLPVVPTESILCSMASVSLSVSLCVWGWVIGCPRSLFLIGTLEIIRGKSWKSVDFSPPPFLVIINSLLC